MFLSTWSTTIKPTLRMDDGLPFAEEQGQEVGTGMELAVAVTQVCQQTSQSSKQVNNQVNSLIFHQTSQFTS